MPLTGPTVLPGSKRDSRPAASLALVLLLAAVLLALGPQPTAAAAEGEFRVTFDPPVDQLVAQGNPDSPKTPTTVTITALGPEGRPLRDAVIEARLTAPDPGLPAGSDVPRVEGRELLFSRFGAPDGRYRFSYLLPIRGDYSLDLRALPAAGSAAPFAPFSATQTFAVGERPAELRLFVALLAALFLFGLISAVLLARPKFRAAARRRAAGGAEGGETPGWIDVPGMTGGLIALGVLFAVFVGFLVVDTVREIRTDTTVAAYQGAGRGVDRAVAGKDAALRYHVDRTSEDGIGVQTLVRTRGELTNPTGGAPPTGAAVRIEALDLETGKPMFATDAPPADGRFAWDLVYWDGVDYKTTVAAAGPGIAPIDDTLELAVMPLAPPLTRKLASMAWLLTPLVAGIGLGLLLARRRWDRGPGRARSQVGPAAAGGAR